MKKSLAAGWLAILLLIAGCQKEAIPADAKEVIRAGTHLKAENILIDRHGELENEERFMKFFKKVQQGKADQIRVTAITAEGDPIYRDLAFDGDALKLVIDTSEDKFGTGEITETACKTLEENDSTERIDYVLEGCSELDGGYVVLVKWK